MITGITCGDREGVTGGSSDPLKNHKNMRLLSNTSPDPLKNLKYVHEKTCSHVHVFVLFNGANDRLNCLLSVPEYRRQIQLFKQMVSHF